MGRPDSYFSIKLVVWKIVEHIIPSLNITKQQRRLFESRHVLSRISKGKEAASFWLILLKQTKISFIRSHARYFLYFAMELFIEKLSIKTRNSVLKLRGQNFCNFDYFIDFWGISYFSTWFNNYKKSRLIKNLYLIVSILLLKKQLYLKKF